MVIARISPGQINVSSGKINGERESGQPIINLTKLPKLSQAGIGLLATNLM